MTQKHSLTLLILVLMLTACQPTIAEPLSATDAATDTVVDTTITLTDGKNRLVELDEPAQQIVSLTPATTEMLFAVGAGAQVIGRDSFSDYPAEVMNLQDVGGSWGEYNQEAIVALQPDLVIAGGINPDELVASLEGLGLTVFFLSNPTTLDEMYSALETIAVLTGQETEASELIESLKARVAAIDDKVAGILERPTVFYELDATDPALPYTAGAGTFVDQLIHKAGGENIGAQLEGEWVQIGLEQLLTLDPEIIILGDSLYGETPEKVAARTGWSLLTAILNDQVFPFDDNLIARPGPRLVEGLEELAKLIHPELFD